MNQACPSLLHCLLSRMSRWVLLCSLAILSQGAVGAAGEPESRPNIIVVLFDDLGYGQPGCYRGDSEFRMPHLDRLARQGMRFTDAHSAAAVCTPTRYGLLTGRYPSRIGQYGVLTTWSPPVIPAARLTVASLLQQHGYATACIGKWHLGMEWSGNRGKEEAIPVGTRVARGPNAAGFDYFYGFTHARNISTIIEQDRVAENVAAVDNQPRMLAKAVHWIEQREAGKPFFLYFPMCPPHTPVVPAPEFAGKGGARDAVKGDPKYGDWVYQGDHMLGSILDVLDRKGFAQNTLVIVTSDNGAAGRVYPPLRDAKGSIYEGGHRVPFVVRWPGKVKPGAVCSHTVCLNDIMATCAGILGAKLPDDGGEDSFSLLPALLDSGKATAREVTIHQAHNGDLAIRQGPWKLIFFRNGKRALFNLDTDPGETVDVAGSQAEVAERLSTLMHRQVELGRSTPGAPQKNDAAIHIGQAPGKRKKGGP